MNVILDTYQNASHGSARVACAVQPARSARSRKASQGACGPVCGLARGLRGGPVCAPAPRASSLSPRALHPLPQGGLR